MLRKGLLAGCAALALAMPATAADMTDSERLRLIQSELEYLIKLMGGPDAVTMARKAAGSEPDAPAAASPASPAAPASAAAVPAAPPASAGASAAAGGEVWKPGWVVAVTPVEHLDTVVGKFEMPVNDGVIDSRAYVKSLNIDDQLTMQMDGFLQATEGGKYAFRLEVPKQDGQSIECYSLLKVNDTPITDQLKVYAIYGGSILGGIDIASPGLVKIHIGVYCHTPYREQVKSMTLRWMLKLPSDDMLRSPRQDEILHKVVKK